MITFKEFVKENAYFGREMKKHKVDSEHTFNHSTEANHPWNGKKVKVVSHETRPSGIKRPMYSLKLADGSSHKSEIGFNRNLS